MRERRENRGDSPDAALRPRALAQRPGWNRREVELALQHASDAPQEAPFRRAEFAAELATSTSTRSKIGCTDASSIGTRANHASSSSVKLAS